jgi:glycosyltransferase involved in cell wall biosynthesis
MGRINVLHIYQNSKIGGIQQQILSDVRGYDREKFNPTVCCFGPKMELGKEIEKAGIDFVALNRQRYNKFSIGIIVDLYRLMKERNIHVLRTHKYRANFYGRIAGKLAGVPVIIASEHNIYRDEKEKRFIRRATNKILAMVTDKMVTVSDAIRKDILRYDGISATKVMVLYNGVDTERFKAGVNFSDTRKQFSISKDDVVIGFVGRLVINKGLNYLIEAAALLKNSFNVKLLIVGDGSLMEELKQMAKDKGLEESVMFTGLRRDITDILSSIDIFVLSSIKEGFPNSLLEAMAMGKPVVATAVGGIPEVISHGTNGLLVQPADKEGLAAAIKTVIDNPLMAKNMGIAARDFIENNYSIKATAGRWEALYKSLLEEKSGLKGRQFYAE